MLKSIFGSLSRERVLTFIAAREEGYASEIVDFWKCPDMPIKRELNLLEQDGVLTAKNYGRTVIYRFNSRYFLRKELQALLLKYIESFPPEIKEKLLFNRRRPRSKGKDIKWLKGVEDFDE